MTTVRLFAGVVLITISAFAQNRLPNLMPSELHTDVAAPSGSTTVEASAVSPLDAPTPHRVIDKKFIAVMSALGGAESMRFTTRKLVIEHEYAAGAPWITSVPSNQRWVGQYSAIYSVEVAVAYELKKPHAWLPGDKVVRKLWWVYPAAMASLHVKNAVGNIRTQGPGGCTSVQCALQQQMQSVDSC